jgi:autotransporter-associated beta strand protein
MMSERARRLLLAAALTVCAATPVVAATFSVNSDASLRNAINSAQNGDTIQFTDHITLNANSDLNAIQRNITIDGGNFDLRANGNRGFLVYSGSVAIQNIVVRGAVAQGGTGGGGSGAGGGGGAGLGGGLFVNAGATVTASGFYAIQNQAIGGQGGSIQTPVGFGGWGGGGGMGGRGGDGAQTGAGGGGGVGQSAGGGSNGNDGSGGTVSGAGSGGTGGPAIPIVGGGTNDGGGAGGGGGGGTSFPINVVVAGGGGVSGGNGSFVNSDGRGGAGGFGGGGGGGGFAINNNIGIGTTAGGGNGGFGGGGGAGDEFGGAGGFGGGGGGGSGMFINNPGGGGGAGGTGGFGGGNGAGTNVLPPSVTGLFAPGGGGAGMGGGIFVREGGTLILGSGFVNSNSVAGGAVGTSLYGGAQAGSAYGEGLFLQGNGTLTLAPPAANTMSILDDIADQTGSGGTGGNAGSWGVVVMGAGQAYLGGDNTYSGGTTIEPGARLRINRNSALGSGAVTIKDQATLVAETNANTIANPIGLAGTATIGVFTATTISGPITGGGNLVVSATANGSYGTLRLSNGGNSYSGATTITAGTLALSGAGSIASSSGLFLASGATFDISGATNGASITTLANAPGSSGADEIIALGSKTLTITNATAVTTFYGGVIQDGGIASGTGGGLVIAGGNQILNGINTYTGSTTIRSGAALFLFAGSLGAGDYAGAIRNDGSLFFSGPAQRLSGVISGSGALTAGSSLTLTGNNTYTGRTNIAAGATLNIVDSGVLGSGNYTGPVVSAGTLRYASSAAQILSGSIGDDPLVSGSPARIVLDGPGDLTLSRASNTFSGGVTVNGGTLRDGANRSFGTGPIVVNGNGALVNRYTHTISSLDVNGSAVVASGVFSVGALTVNGAVTGTGSLQVGDNGLFNSSLRLGATTNSIGTLAIGFAGSVIFTGGTGSKLVVGSDFVGNWGSGNSFNPTAGVTGGTIEAAGTGTLQTITGAQVNNGGSATPTLLFGNVHVGATASFAIKNTGTNTPMLRGAVQTTGLSGGAVTGLTDGDFGPIASGSSTGPYTLTAATAGPLSGQTVRVVSNFANVPTQTIAVAGNVYAYAAPSLSSTSVSLNNFHVGQNPGPGSFPIQNTATGPNGYVETLGVTPTASGSSFFASPTSFKVGAGGTGFVNVFLSGGVAGLNTGTVALGLVSDGADIGNGLGTTPLPGQTVSVSAKGYALAAATPSTASVTMTAFHVGSTSSGNFQVQNTGVGPSGYVEALNVATVAGMNRGQLSATPFLPPVGQGASETVYLSLTGGAAGPNSGIVILSLSSDGNAIGNGLGVTSLSGQSVTVTATGYNYAAPQYQKAGGDGTLMGSGTAYTLDFGTVTAGTTVSGSLNLLNALVGGATSIYTDLLSGTFSFSSGSFDFSGFTNFSSVAGGSASAPLTVGFDAGKEGFFQQIVTLNPSSDNTAGLGSTPLGPIMLTIAGNVVAVPEPATWALIAVGFIGFVARRGHRRDA